MGARVCMTTGADPGIVNSVFVCVCVGGGGGGGGVLLQHLSILNINVIPEIS